VSETLVISVVDARPERYAATPTLVFRMRLDDAGGEVFHSIALRCQIRIEPQRRRYTPAEEARLLELFGETPRWGDTLKPFLWSHVSTVVQGFAGSTQADLPVACSYDLEVAGAKYLHSLDDGEIPLVFLFSGTIFAKAEHGLKVVPVSWNKDASYRMPVSVWRELMDTYFPNAGWLRLSRETLDRLTRFKAENAIASWDQVFEALLEQAKAKEKAA
jgi:uncharacterized protein DUF6084